MPGELKQQFERLPAMSGTSKGWTNGGRFLIKPQMYQLTGLYNNTLRSSTDGNGI